MRSCFYVLIAVWICMLYSPASAAERRLNVTDYFLMLPPGPYFEVPAKMLLAAMKANGDVVDNANGYLNCPGDGAQTTLQVALFRYKDDRPLVAVSWGDLEIINNNHLQFFEMKGDALKAVPRSILPVKDLEKGSFDLPRHGRTILVQNSKGKTVRKFTWTGERFQEEK